MTLFVRLTFTFASLLFCIVKSSCGQTTKKDLIVGNWDFEKFQFSGQLANAPTKEEKQANEANKGLIIKFTTDNKYSSEQKGGMAINNSKGTYKMLFNDRIIIIGDTVKIFYLDKNYLKLYRDDFSPIVILRRQ